MNHPFRLEGEALAVDPARLSSAIATVPGSKSLTNRYLLLAALAEGVSTLAKPLESDDTGYMRQALSQIGVDVTEEDDGWHIVGKRHWRQPDQELFVGNAGTVMRFFSPALALHPMTAIITGNERMLVRPIGDLVEGLRQRQVQVDYLGASGRPPLKIQGPLNAGKVTIRGDASSQYLSGLLMSLPLIEGDSEIEISSDLVSKTYVAMTLDCMKQMGVEVEIDPSYRHFRIPGGQHYQARQLTIEPDASTASYWIGLPFMSGGSVTLENVPEQSHQGDFGLLDILDQMGAQIERKEGRVTITESALSGVDVDMNTMSDVAPTLAVIATRATSPTTIRNVYNMRIKECDRIQTLQTAFDALGLAMESGRDWMRIHPGEVTDNALLDPEDDHRMAMVFALLGLADGQVRIKDPECVAKTYPSFYDDFATALTA